jgi:predicted CXXCH cytochrome family protein
MKSKTQILKKWCHQITETTRLFGWSILFLGAGVSVFLISCATGNREVVVPPNIPGATFTGTESCVPCHENHTRDFDGATHSAVKMDWSEVGSLGCETCHGPGSIHVETGGAFHTIVNPGTSPEVCFQCHLELRSRFALPSHHPIRADSIGGKEVTCAECHPSHKGPAIPETTTLLYGVNEGCIKCHPAQRGPYAFEHEAMREGCVSCHQPHGSVNAKLLTERNGNLCLKCHIDTRSSDITVGGLPHQYLMQRGTCWTAGCHEAVHGSQVSSSLRF